MFLEYPILSQIIVFLINAAGISLLVIVIFSDAKKNIVRLFSLMTLSILVWVDFAFIARFTENTNISLISIKVAWIITPILSNLIYLFIGEFLELMEKGGMYRKSISYSITSFSMLISAVTLISDFVIEDIVLVEGVLNIIYGNLIWIYLLYIFILVLISIWVLFTEYYKTSSVEKMTKIRTVAYGFVVFFVQNSIFNLILPIFFGVAHLYEFGDYSTIILLSFIAYAIVRHKLFGITLVLSVFLVSVLGNFILLDLFFFATDSIQRIGKIIMLILFLIVGYILIKNIISGITQRKKLSQKNKELDNMFNLSNNLLKAVDISDVFKSSVEGVSLELGYQGAILSIIDFNSQELGVVAISKNEIMNSLDKVLKNKISHLRVKLNSRKNTNLLSVRSVDKDKLLLSKSFHEVFSPVLSNEEIDLVERTLASTLIVAVPIKYGAEVKGIMTYFLDSKLLEQITQEDKNLMQTFASEISIALQNAELLEETRKITKQLESQNTALESKNKELDTIFRITNEIVTTLDPKEVAQRAVDTIPDELGYIGAMITLIDNKDKSYRMISITSGEMGQKLKSYMLEKNSACKYDSEKRFNTIPHDNDHFMIGNSLEEAITSLVPQGEGDEIQKILGINTIVNTPIKTRNKTVGVMSFFLSFDNDEEIRTTEFDLMQTFAYQVGIGLENARLFNQYQELTKELAIKNEQLEDYAEKEKDILDIMGHELRTPITIVRNSLSFLKMMVQGGKASPEKVNHYIDVALRSAKREINIIETMLAATKVEADKIEIFRSQVNTKEIIDEALLGQKTNADKKGLVINVEIPENIPNIFMDRSRGQEIVDNFLSNAVKYTQQGAVTIRLEEEGDFVRFNIIDTGMGIPKSEMESLGKKFHRIKQHISEKPEGGVKDSKGNDDTAKEKRLYNVVRPGGTGLGLYVTFNLVKLHGGVVKVTSEIGKGSNFSFTMPKFVGQESEVDETKSKNLLEEYRMRKSGDKVSDQ